MSSERPASAKDLSMLAALAYSQHAVVAGILANLINGDRTAAAADYETLTDLNNALGRLARELNEAESLPIKSERE